MHKAEGQNSAGLRLSSADWRLSFRVLRSMPTQYSFASGAQNLGICDVRKLLESTPTGDCCTFLFLSDVFRVTLFDQVMAETVHYQRLSRRSDLQGFLGVHVRLFDKSSGLCSLGFPLCEYVALKLLLTLS